MVTRRTHWEMALASFLAERTAQPFAWGENDCCLFACDAVLAITGIDIATDFRGRYHDRTSAGAAMRAFCGGGVKEVALKISRQFDIPQWPGVRLARRGDVVLFQQRRRWTLGIVSMNGFELLAPGEAGMARLPIDLSDCAWRVG